MVDNQTDPGERGWRIIGGKKMYDVRPAETDPLDKLLDDSYDYDTDGNAYFDKDLAKAAINAEIAKAVRQARIEEVVKARHLPIFEGASYPGLSMEMLDRHLATLTTPEEGKENE